MRPAAAILFCLPLWAQAPEAERVLKFVHTSKAQDQQEIATAIRTTVEIRQLKVDPEQRTMTVRVTPDQEAFTEWLFQELDQPSAPRDSSIRTFAVATTDPDNRARIFFLNHAATVQNFQELATAVRTTAEARRVFTYNALRAMIVRGTANQIELTAWLVDQLNQPPETTPPGPPPAFHLLGDPLGEDEVRIVFIRPRGSKDFQELGAQLRASGPVRRTFIVAWRNAIVLRGTLAQVTRAVNAANKR